MSPNALVTNVFVLLSALWRINVEYCAACVWSSYGVWAASPLATRRRTTRRLWRRGASAPTLSLDFSMQPARFVSATPGGAVTHGWLVSTSLLTGLADCCSAAYDFWRQFYCA